MRKAGTIDEIWNLTGNLLLLLLIFVSLSLVARGEPFSAVEHADLDRDGNIERIDLDSERAATLEIRHGRKLLWSGVPTGWKPWKLQIADVDGDGRLEIAVGIFKPTKFFPKPHNCLFIYGWDGNRAFAKWLGSSLGRPFTDFLFADIIREAGDELIAIETSLEKKKSLALYRWNSFGFTLESRDGNWRAARLLSASFEKILVEADGSVITALARTGAGNEKPTSTRSVYLDISNDMFD